MSNVPLGAELPPPDLTGPFRGSAALAGGLLTRGVLRGPRFRRLFPDVYAPADLEPDLALRARAAGVLVAGHGAVAGYAAAELWGASCAPPDEPAHALLTQRYRCDGLRVHRDYFDFSETVPIGSGGAVTSPARTAYDLARWSPRLVERVVALDALAHNCGVDLDAVRSLRRRYLGCHGGADITEALRLADQRSESPMETRVRVALVLGDLPPEVQYPVVVNGRRYRLDLAYPALLVAVEYDGQEHRSQARARRDLLREADLSEAGWRILRFDGGVVMRRPDQIVAEVRAELAARQGLGR
jgi:very-short-patch-repair endonuclease